MTGSKGRAGPNQQGASEPLSPVPAVPASLNARTRVASLTRDADSSWVADLLTQERDSIVERWIEAAAAQPFHAGRREQAVTDHIPALIYALTAVLRRTSSATRDPRAPLHEAAVLAAAQAHAKMRMSQGLVASDIVTEFRLLRQEIGGALRSHLDDSVPTTDVLGAEILLHDALDDAAFLAVLAVDDHEAEVERLRQSLALEQRRLAAILEYLPTAVVMAEAPSGQISLTGPTSKPLSGAGVPVPAGENPAEWQGFHRDGRRYTAEDWPLARAVRTGQAVTGEEID